MLSRVVALSVLLTLKVARLQTHAGAKVAETASGAWLQLRDALDYSDATRFPVAQFGGPVARENTDRLRKILSQYAPMGAVCSDVATASASRHASRPRQGINSIGWRIWPTNYGKWMTQLEPMGTSVGTVPHPTSIPDHSFPSLQFSR